MGDELNPLIVQEVSERPVKRASLQECSLISIGSILEVAASAQREQPIWVWGSGFIRSGSKLMTRVKTKNLRFAAVRGPLSAKRLPRRQRPRALGDPAVLSDRLQRQRPQKRWELGVVPHYVDSNHPLVEKLQDSQNSQEGVTLISPLSDPEEFVESIASCRALISSSLHGLVVADSVGTPNIWAEFSEQIIGKGYKYRDYLANFKISNPRPYQLTSVADLNLRLVRSIEEHYARPGIEQMKKDLVAEFPRV